MPPFNNSCSPADAKRIIWATSARQRAGFCCLGGRKMPFLTLDKGKEILARGIGDSWHFQRHTCVSMCVQSRLNCCVTAIYFKSTCFGLILSLNNYGKCYQHRSNNHFFLLFFPPHPLLNGVVPLALTSC